MPNVSELQHIIDRVKAMRSLQKQYFALAKTGDVMLKQKVLRQSKEVEKEVDKLIDGLDEVNNNQLPLNL